MLAGHVSIDTHDKKMHSGSRMMHALHRSSCTCITLRPPEPGFLAGASAPTGICLLTDVRRGGQLRAGAMGRGGSQAIDRMLRLPRLQLQCPQVVCNESSSATTPAKPENEFHARHNKSLFCVAFSILSCSFFCSIALTSFIEMTEYLRRARTHNVSWPSLGACGGSGGCWG